MPTSQHSEGLLKQGLSQLPGGMVITIPLPEIASGLPKNLTFSYRLEKRFRHQAAISVENFRVQMPSEDDVIRALKKSGRSLSDKARIIQSHKLHPVRQGSRQRHRPHEPCPEVKVNFDIVMKNHTKARLDFRNLDYDFLVNDSKLVDGSTKDIRNSGSVSVCRSATSSAQRLWASRC
jgi:hypothetical protein